MRRNAGLWWLVAIAFVLPTICAAENEDRGGTGWDVMRIQVRENGRLVVPVTVNGKRDCRFLFDTGAMTTVLSERLATKAGVNATTTKQVKTYAGSIRLSSGRVRELVFGHQSVAAIDVLIADLGRLFRLDSDIEGIIGEDVLFRFNYLLDRRHRRLEIEEDGNPAPGCAGTKVAFEKRAGKMYVPAAGGEVRLMLDSGNPYLVLYEDTVPKFQPVADIKAAKFVESSIGSRAIRPFRIKSLEILGTRLVNVQAYLTERDPGRFEDGFLPLHLFDSIYVNNVENFVIANPERCR